MTIPMEDERWGHLVREPASASARPIVDDRPSTVSAAQFDALSRYVGDVATHLARLTDEIRGVAAQLSDQVTHLAIEVGDAKAAAEQARDHVVGAVQAIDQQNLAALERFRESLNRLGGDLGDALIQVSSRLGAAEALGRSITAAAGVLGDERTQTP